jgi:glycerophosphoryl diester phosphodiesterase
MTDVTPTSPEDEPGQIRPSGPLVFAHRGSSAALPEHTLAAYLRAIDEGADGLECDVRLTRDGHLVCVHDRRLDRVSDGKGPVSAYDLAELEALDFGSWHPAWPASADDLITDRPESLQRTPVLTLEALLDAALDAGRTLRLLIETKHPTRFGGEVEDRLVEALQVRGLHEPKPDSALTVTVMSFSALAVRRMRELAPRIETVWLTELATPGLRDGRLPFGAKIAGPSVRLIKSSPSIVKRMHAVGNRVYVWTVNDPKDIDLMIDLGVDGIISDRPATVLAHLGR